MFQNLQSCQCVFSIDIIEIFSEKVFQELFEMDINIFGSPFATATGWKVLFAKEALERLSHELVHSDVDCASSAVEHHHYLVLDE